MAVVLCLISTYIISQPDLFAFGDESSPIDNSANVNFLQNQSDLQTSISWSDLIPDVADINDPTDQEVYQMSANRMYGDTLPQSTETIGIYTPQDLSDMRNDPSLHYTLMNDIDLTAYTAAGDGWLPIGTSEAPFTGTLDGNGHVITGLRIFKYSQNTTSFVGGLFGYGVGMTVKNLSLNGEINTVAARAGRYLYLGGLIGHADRVTLTGCNVNIKIKAKAETTDIGGLIGHAVSSVHDETGGSVIDNCTTSGEINSSGRAYDLGGTVGEGARLTITNTVNHIKVYGLCTAPDRESTTAGIVGRFTSGAIIDSTNDGIIKTDVSNIYMTNTSSAYAGGIAGVAVPLYGYGDFFQTIEISGCLNKGALASDRMGTITQAGIVVIMSRGVVSDCENQGKIQNFTAYEGGAYGIIADGGNAIITGCTNKADILCSAQWAAGIAGFNIGTISECSNWGAISSLQVAGGIVAHNSGGVVSKCINAGEIAGSLGSFESAAGGIVSQNQGDIIDCYNIGVIRGSFTGGIAAYSGADRAISNCFNMGSVYSPVDINGAIVGDNNSLIRNCYYDPGMNKGCGSNSELALDYSKKIDANKMKTMDSYVGFDFLSDDSPAVWAMSTVTGYPRLTAVEEVYVSSLSIAKAPKKLSYLINEKIDTKGLILKATLSNGNMQYLDYGYILGAYAKTSGTRAISVSYAGKSTSFNASFTYFTLAIGSDSCMMLDYVDFPGAVTMRFYLSYSAGGPYSLWLTSDYMVDGVVDSYLNTPDLILNKTHYFKIQPVYPKGAGPVYGYNAIRFKPPMPEIYYFSRTESGAQMDCVPVGRIEGSEMYCATSIGGPYTKVADSTNFTLFYGGLKKGTYYFFVSRTFVYSNGVKVYSDYSPVQWGRFL